MKSKQVRQSFLDFFKRNGHQIVRSASLVPAGDPTLLFTNAGMNQFKDIFLGQRGKIKYRRVADSQKCIRVAGKHNDLEDVGKDTSHHTFFEMLGNWSFGDYYKEEAILFAYELFTKEWGLPKDRLWLSVYEEDDEAAELWAKVTGFPPSRIVRLGAKENFWEMGDIGPCGPCSEILMLRGDVPPAKDVNPVDNEDFFLELWNLVFIQFNRKADGTLEELPEKHIDTGMGFERITAVLQGKNSNYDTDLFTPIIELVEDITGKSYQNGSQQDDAAFRVAADHVRTLAFAIADGIVPSNEGRGYVLRRILRRAVKYGRNLGIHEPFLYKLVSPLADVMGEDYPEILEKNQYLTRMIRAEEENFGQTIDRGIEIFEEESARLLKRNLKVLPGEAAFKLHDTYGFPLDLTALLADEKGLKVDTDGFNAAMELQKERSRQDRGVMVYGEEGKLQCPRKKTRFDYKNTELETTVIKIISDEGHPLDFAPTGSYVRVFLTKTPFYGESGGQVGDQGTISVINGKGVVFIKDTQKPAPGEILHVGEVVEGTISLGDKVKAVIDVPRRQAIIRNHTATHLLHRALKEVLDEHVNQSGSLVAPEHLRFDFNHFQKLTIQEIRAIEERVNEMIRSDLKVTAKARVPYQQAVDEGATALFGEKYGDSVRVVSVDKCSKELCGGTHVQRTGQIGFFKIISETSTASGIRRIEALTGEYADKWASKYQDILEEGMAVIHSKEDNFITRLQQIVEELKGLEKQVKEFRSKAALPEFREALTKGKKIEDKFIFCSGQLTVDSVDELMKYGDLFRKDVKSGIGIFGARQDTKAILMAVITDDLISGEHLHAGEIVKKIAPLIGGGGGGRPHMATAGGKDVDKLPEALKKARNIVERYYAEKKGNAC